MTEIIISAEIKNTCPDIQLGCIECNVMVSPQTDVLWRAIDEERMAVRNTLALDSIKKMPAIAASRKVYKALGKDPARYRLSAEALLRRLVKGEKLYQVNNVVDMVNLASFLSGFSIGGYDVDKIDGQVIMGVGSTDEAYNAIGRGELNIESLPVLRDGLGAFGSPTSDSERTAVTDKTTRFLMVFFNFGVPDLLQHAMDDAVSLLIQHAGAKNIETKIIAVE